MLRLSRSRQMQVYFTTLDERTVARVRACRLDGLCFVLCFDGDTLTVTVWALRVKTPTPTVRPWLGRVAGVSVRRMRTRWRAYTRFTYVTDSTTGDLLMRNNRGSLDM